MLDDVIDFFTAGAVGLLGWFFGGIDGFVKVLITFSIIDFITGFMAAYTKHELNSSVGFNGICRKISMFCLVGVAHIIDLYMLGDTAMLKTSVTLFYAVNEGISIFENVDVLGIPIPQFLKDRLFNLKEQMTSQEHQGHQELATTQGNDKLTHRSRRNRASAANKEAKDNNKGKKQEGQRPQGSKEAGYDTGNYNVVALDISSHEFPRHHNVTGHSVNGANATVAEDSNSKTLDSKEDKEDKEEADTDNAESDDEDDKCVSNGAGE
ncbi:MAG: phage holin family protein [Synergistaceae bacterium]|nr:phage holin family protein [Synergistaceae bacterium]